jgi:hypothetical protein
MEKIGIPKRDLVVKRIVATQSSQEAAKQQFTSALDRFKSVLNFDGGQLEDKYDALNSELKRCESRATDLHSRVLAVTDVSTALFSEWEAELSQYSSEKLRRSSGAKLLSARKRYDEMLRAMRASEAKLEPVLKPLRDNVLFLKHNLNARAVSSLSEDLRTVEANVDELVRDLERSIDESSRFIREIDN